MTLSLAIVRKLLFVKDKYKDKNNDKDKYVLRTPSTNSQWIRIWTHSYCATSCNYDISHCLSDRAPWEKDIMEKEIMEKETKDNVTRFCWRYLKTQNIFTLYFLLKRKMPSLFIFDCILPETLFQFLVFAFDIWQPCSGHSAQVVLHPNFVLIRKE